MNLSDHLSDEPHRVTEAVPRRFARLAAARRAVGRALDATLDDLSDLFEDATGRRGPGRLAVFHVRSLGEGFALHRIQLAHQGEVATLEPVADDLAVWTELYGDLVDIASRYGGASCSEGLVVLLRGTPASICAYPAEHCGHWEGYPLFAVDYPPPMRDAPPELLEHPHCCPQHRVEAALERHGLQPPSVRTQHDCDEPRETP